MTSPAAPTWGTVLGRLDGGLDLDADSARWAVEQIMSGQADPDDVKAFLLGVQAKGATAAEVAGAAEAMRAVALRVEVPGILLDVVGTGGDSSGSVNFSTMAAIVAAACGATIVKHGNRASSSKCGTADVLEELGIAIDLGPEAIASCARELGIAFAFAQVLHPAMKHAAPIRRELGVPTIFNILGPLTNPARPGADLIGCSDARMAPVMAQVFADRGDRVLVVRGDNGWDEISPYARRRDARASRGRRPGHGRYSSRRACGWGCGDQCRGVPGGVRHAARAPRSGVALGYRGGARGRHRQCGSCAGGVLGCGRCGSR
jgi:anthranilate phosphoribosyltransferase